MSSHRVESWLECGQMCLKEEDCVSFSHQSDESYDEINCQLSSQTQYAELIGQDIEEWRTIYEVRDVESVSNS